MEFIAHVRKVDGEKQFLKNHLLETADIAEKIGCKIGLGKMCRLAGVLHDAGKYSDEFQAYLQEAVANPDDPPKRGSVDHSSAGGIFLFHELHGKTSKSSERFVAEIVGNVIVAHHSSKGLTDYISMDGHSSYLNRVKDLEKAKHLDKVFTRFYSETMSSKELRQLMNDASHELLNFYRTHLSKKNIEERYSSLFFILKYVYSALIDADRSNTISFEENDRFQYSCDSQVIFDRYYQRLMLHLDTFSKENSGLITEINQLRNQMSEECESFAKRESGIYTLSIPTGGGKTLASMRFALKHSLLHHMDRIIYIVPFTTIIEQNAATVKRILGDPEWILEHHSNVVEEKEYDNYFEEKRNKLAKDNWDAPIIFTTMVQFLETIYAKGTRNVRRLHNLSHAVLIFDEVQSVPVKCINLFNKSLNFLQEFCKTTCVLCTATQPALDDVKVGLNLSDSPEMVGNLDAVTKAFKRVEIDYEIEKPEMSLSEFTVFIRQKHDKKDSILIILNTKLAAKKVYLALQELDLKDTVLYHLSTSMCGNHRKDKLKEIQKGLDDGVRLICVATQLIEAGVDVSFQCVIRSMAGLSSIAQAAGRCNRNGEAPVQDVYLVKLGKEVENTDNAALSEIRKGKVITEELLYYGQRGVGEKIDLLSDTIMNKYFQRYYKDLALEATYPTGFDRNLLEAAGSNRVVSASYEDEKTDSEKLLMVAEPERIGREFRVIDANTKDILVPYDERAKELIAAFNGEIGAGDLSRMFKEAQGYMVSIYENTLNELSQKQLIYRLYNGDVLALIDQGYDQEFGVDPSGESPMGAGVY